MEFVRGRTSPEEGPGPGLTRLALGLSYDGSAYHGWARQPHQASIQGTLEAAIRRALGWKGLGGLVVAGRTDAGVHGRNQVAHLDVPQAQWAALGPGVFMRAVQGALPLDIRLQWVQDQGQGLEGPFHARFSALARHYRYTLVQGTWGLPFGHNHHWYLDHNVALEPMEEALKTIVGTHDFRAFRGAGCQAHTTTRTIHYARLVTHDHGFIHLDLGADGFLQNMVRIITGTLVSIGRGKLPKGVFEDAFKNGLRSSLGPTAPPQGLYFTGVDYNAIHRIPSWRE